MKKLAITLLKGFGYVWIGGAIIFTIYSFATIVLKAPAVGQGFGDAIANWPGYVVIFAPGGIALVLVERLQGGANK
jgi:hypothetical protein